MKKIMILVLLNFITLGINAQTIWKMQPIMMQTRWANDVTPTHTLEDYPRPQMIRNNWKNLNGLWQYAITEKGVALPKTYDGDILVPYPIESALSGVKKALLPDQNLWYKRNISYVANKKNRTLIHFDAVDWQATIYVNGKEAGTHTGGYTAFTLDITSQLNPGQNEIVVKVYDPTDAGISPHGKQTINPQNIYYTASSGIWQTVWLETVPKDYIENLSIKPDIDKSVVKIQTNSKSQKPVTIVFNKHSYKGKSNQTFTIPVKNAKLWSPESPFLYTFIVKQGDDVVQSYFGMRKISIQKDSKGIDRIALNNKSYYNLGTLDQGFWPEGLYTAPTDEALVFDIKAIKAMGFNTIRKHIKVEPAKWYYAADKIGMLVWQDMVNPNQSLPQGSKTEFEKESKEILHQLQNYPCITSWVLFNEEWGAYDQARLTNLIKQIDSSRIINGHSGGYLYVNGQKSKGTDSVYVNSDMTDIHSYPQPMLSKKEINKAQVCGEFGGIGVSVPGNQWNDMQGWGYVQATPKEFIAKYKIMNKRLASLKDDGLSGSIYTQPFDVEEEENGLLTYNREFIKMPLATIRSINSELVQLTPLQKEFIIAKDINQDDTDERYPDFLKRFEEGIRDSSFLRRLVLMAIRKKEQFNVTKVGNAYVEQLKKPYSKENLVFISHITRTSEDNGFKIFRDHAIEVNETLGENKAETKVRQIAAIEELDPYLKNKSIKPKWKEIESSISSKFGNVGMEKYYGERMLWSLENQDWTDFIIYYNKYFSIAYQWPEYIINNLSWSVFEHATTAEDMEVAIKTMQYSITRWDKDNPAAFDTYANLLYKAGRIDEAILWEEKALKLSNNDKEFAQTLVKMKLRTPTW
jgi:tetratricopeptide (TPR) repeat protein